jgi:hypothetical protein
VKERRREGKSQPGTAASRPSNRAASYLNRAASYLNRAASYLNRAVSHLETGHLPAASGVDIDEPPTLSEQAARRRVAPENPN